MDALTDTKHEAFAQYVAAGLSQTAACTKAGFQANSAHNIGSRLAKRPEIQHRIDDLKVRSAEGSKVSQQWIIDRAIEIERAALAAEDYSAAIRALELVARVSGYLNERKESLSHRVNVHELRSPQLAELLARDGRALPEAQRVELIAAAPELAEVFDTRSQCGQLPKD